MPAAFYTGNVLPDLVGQAGRSSLRRASVVGRVGPIADGVRLHLDVDQRFHTDPAFLAGCEHAGALLRGTALTPPPRRVFFLAHVAYELALDAALLTGTPDLAEDLYAQLAQGRAAALEFLAESTPPRFEEHYDRFIEHGYLRRYTRPETLARALRGIASRVGEGLLPTDDAAISSLAAFFEQLTELVTPDVEPLLLRLTIP